MKKILDQLRNKLDGELLYDNISKTIYSTDASDFKETPLAVCFPKHANDVQTIVEFAAKNKIKLIPRAAGTSLAGQVVGSGLVVDVSRYMNKIIEINVEEKWVRVEPGVVRDELNMQLKQYNLFFAPETSTANRATIGGMVGNNACGSNSIVYGSTREHLLASTVVLSDASFATFGEINLEQFYEKTAQKNLEGKIYADFFSMLDEKKIQSKITAEFPKPSISRRNTGYALDSLIKLQPFNTEGKGFNFSKLIAGSEGTLAFLTEIKLQLYSLPPTHTNLLCIHCNSIDEIMDANLECVNFEPFSLELIDHYILDCTKNNLEYKEYTFFVQGNPHGILIAEFKKDNKEELNHHIQKVIHHLQKNQLGYAFFVVEQHLVSKVWGLRKAGLGLLANIPGDKKAVAVIEDTAVDIYDLKKYINDFNAMLKKYNLYAVHYAHIGTGELHLRPLINLKSKTGLEQYRIVATEIAQLVKKYKGSLSGEHGDGRLRGEFLEFMVGTEVYQLFINTKHIWDKDNIFNPNKIIHTPRMDEFLRYEADYPYPIHKTLFRYKQGDWLRDIHQCNGSGDCRKSHLSGGTMCPSFMATKNEKHTTRARANMLSAVLGNAENLNQYNSKEVYEILDLCLSCKGCKNECPSNIDMAKFKAEFLEKYYQHNTISLRNKMVANFSTTMKFASKISWVYNFFNQTPGIQWMTKKTIGFAPKRSLPLLASQTLHEWFISHHQKKKKKLNTIKTVYFFCDEFTNYLDVEIGKQTILLLENLNYNVIIPQHLESGRSFFSKGLLQKAKNIANKNIELLSDIINADCPLIGVEPSCILTFRDEYPDLVDEHLIQKAIQLATHTFLIEEFLLQEFENKNIQVHQFVHANEKIILHGHCQQKAIAKISSTEKLLQLVGNDVQTLPSGCCGMAGSFGYEAEHYDLSMQVGELVLFPNIRKAKSDVLIVASGTSCRHQIKDGTKVKALHPVEILYQQLKKLSF